MGKSLSSPDQLKPGEAPHGSVDLLISIRKRAGLTQTEMAHLMGLTRWPYQAIENRRAKMRTVHLKALERISIQLAIDNNDIFLAPDYVRQDALALIALGS